MQLEKGCHQGLLESGRSADNKDSDLAEGGASVMTQSNIHFRSFYGWKSKLPREERRRGQGHRASPGFSQGQISFGAGDGGGPRDGMLCHLALATHHSLSLLCHPGSGQGCARNMAPCVSG